MESKVCVVCNPEKSVDNFSQKCRECKQCNIERVQNVTLKTKKNNYQMKQKYTTKEIERCYLQSLK